MYLTLNETIRQVKVGGRGNMVYVMALQEFGKLIRCKRGTIFSVEQGRWSVLGYGFLQAHTQGLGRIGGHFVNEGVLTEQIADQ